MLLPDKSVTCFCYHPMDDGARGGRRGSGPPIPQGLHGMSQMGPPHFVAVPRPVSTVPIWSSLRTTHTQRRVHPRHPDPSRRAAEGKRKCSPLAPRPPPVLPLIPLNRTLPARSPIATILVRRTALDVGKADCERRASRLSLDLAQVLAVPFPHSRDVLVS